MSGLLASLTEKAQALAQASPLAGKIPGTTAPEPSGGGSSGGSANSRGSHTLESLHHQLRSLGQQYSSATPLQKMITSSKGVSIDFDSVSRDAHGHSKELYLWGQAEGADLKDVTDRLAYINYVHGSLAGTLAGALNSAREPLKELRNAETALGPHRTARAALQSQIARIEHAQERGAEARVIQLREQLAMAERTDVDAEKDVERLKRVAVRDGERAKWAALREYGEKIVLLAQAASLVTEALPTTPPSANTPYTGGAQTASARAALQRALDNYKTGHIALPAQHEGDIDAASIASFGDTHGAELAALDTAAVASAATATRSSVPLTPPEASPGTYAPPAGPPPVHPDRAASQPVATMPTGPTSPGLDTSKLNQAPAPLPTSPEGSTTIIDTAAPASPSGDATTPLAGMTPTVAETGVPVAAGAGGPGPASGSLAELRRERFGGDSAAPSAATPGTYGESAEDEKKRLQREERERLLAGGPSATTAPAYESADDEKKRLQREERERILAGGGGQQQQQQQPPRQGSGGEDADLPPYQEPF